MFQFLLLCALPLAQASRTSDTYPPLPPATDGSLWDYIEAPTDADAHDRSRSRRQTRELARTRYAEDDYIRQAREAVRVPVDFYTDPAGHIADDPLYLSQIDPRDFDIPVVVNEDMVVEDEEAQQDVTPDAVVEDPNHAVVDEVEPVEGPSTLRVPPRSSIDCWSWVEKISLIYSQKKSPPKFGVCLKIRTPFEKI